MHIIDNQDIIEIPALFDHTPEWVAIVLLFCISLVGYLRVSFTGKLTNYSRAFFIRRYANQVMREEHSLSNPVSRNLTIIFFLSESLFLLSAIVHYGLYTQYISFSFTSFVFVLGILFGITLLRLFFSWLTGIIFARTAEGGESVFLLFQENHLTGLFLIPVNVFVIYGESYIQTPFFAIGTGILIIAYLYRVGGSIASALQRPEIKWFYLILYLCTLEILPLLIGYKVLRALA